MHAPPFKLFKTDWACLWGVEKRAASENDGAARAQKRGGESECVFRPAFVLGMREKAVGGARFGPFARLGEGMVEWATPVGRRGEVARDGTHRKGEWRSGC